jgi:glycosyltransferase involved in cell wall biosynthesis
MRSRSILCVHLLDDFSGSAKMCAEVVSILTGDGRNVTVWVGAAGEPGVIRKRHTVAGHFYYRVHRSRLMQGVSLGLSQMHLFLKTFGFCVLRRPDCVYVSTILPFGAILGARAALTRVVCHVHEVSLGTKALHRLLDAVVRGFAQRIICVSEYMAERLRYPKERTVVVHNSLSEREWQRASDIADHRGSRPHDPFCVLMACSLKWYKGIDSFLALAAEASRTTRPSRMVLALNCERFEFDCFAASHAANDVHLVWRPDSISQYYEAADLVVNLSHAEGWIETFGLTLLEGMTSGVPVVSPIVGGCTELFDHGEGGWRIDSRDLPGLLELIRRLRNEPELWRKGSVEARLRASMFQPEDFRRRIIGAVCGSWAPVKPIDESHRP